MTTPSETVQIYRVYIQATPEAIWEAITEPEWTVQYGYAPVVEYDLHPGGAFRAYANEGMKALGCPEIISDGEVIESNPPRKLVQTYRMTMTPELAAEAFTRLTYDLEPVRGLLGRWMHKRQLDKELRAPIAAAPARLSDDKRRRLEEARALVDEVLGGD